MLWKNRPRALAALAACAALLVTGGIAWAVAPAADSSQVNACVNKSNGQVRIVDAASECKNNERCVSWNQKGAKGDPGLDGKDGVDGKDGRDGVDGKDGTGGGAGGTIAYQRGPGLFEELAGYEELEAAARNRGFDQRYLALDPGKYMVTALVDGLEAADSQYFSNNVSCELRIRENSDEDEDGSLTAQKIGTTEFTITRGGNSQEPGETTSPSDAIAQGSIVAPVTLTERRVVRVFCQKETNSDDALSARLRSISAVKLAD